MRRFLTFCLTALAALTALPAAQAQTPGWPSRAITLISPYAPGGSTGILAHLLAEPLGKALGQSVVVEFKPGAGGNIGTGYVAHAKPDGYTFLVASSGPVMISPALYDKLNYKPESDFTAISPLANTSFVIVVNPNSGLTSIQDIIAQGKAGKLSFGSAGSGSPQHIIGEMFNTATGAKIQHIPYKGSGPMVTDLLGGQIPMSVENPLVVMPHVRTGKLKVLAVTGARRSATQPDVPTLDELGIKGFDARPWYGFLGPAGLPADVAQRMHKEVQAILARPEVKQKLNDLGVEPMAMTSAEFKDMILKDIAKWGAAVKASGAKGD
jgi:tripartite-type tricarboxylate transporter receptor subunit TctC